MSSEAIPVTHDTEGQRFVALVDGLRSECVYRLQGDTAVFVHTEVPWQQQGRGIAAALVAAALAWARKAGLRVRPACSYVGAYMRRHPETQDLLPS